ncbi:MAG TPA: hypothetical protein VFV81_10355, partial [Verrucomicrobiae bacterium]|nr:hypothetical protein [Verrucomicrobiae bacterium]
CFSGSCVRRFRKLRRKLEATRTPIRRINMTAFPRLVRVALYLLVPLAYLSMPFWRPLGHYGKAGADGSSLACTILILAVLVVSLWSWNRHRVVASLGLIACGLYLLMILLPVI